MITPGYPLQGGGCPPPIPRGVVHAAGAGRLGTRRPGCAQPQRAGALRHPGDAVGLQECRRSPAEAARLRGLFFKLLSSMRLLGGAGGGGGYRGRGGRRGGARGRSVGRASHRSRPELLARSPYGLPGSPARLGPLLCLLSPAPVA